MRYARGDLYNGSIAAGVEGLWRPNHVFRAGPEGVGPKRGGQKGGGRSVNLSTLSDKGESRASEVHHSPRRGGPKGEST